MVLDEKDYVEAIVKDESLLKSIELQNIGFLDQQPVIVNCPACEVEALSIVRLEVVTYLQRFLKATKLCKYWRHRHDFNHYCSKCGCYIGRYVPIDCSESCLSRSALKMAASGTISLKTTPKDCAAKVQKSREKVKAKRAAEKADKEAIEAPMIKIVVQEEA